MIISDNDVKKAIFYSGKLQRLILLIAIAIPA